MWVFGRLIIYCLEVLKQLVFARNDGPDFSKHTATIADNKIGEKWLLDQFMKAEPNGIHGEQ